MKGATATVAYLPYALALLIFFITARGSGTPIAAGLDASYAFAFNYFFVNGVQIGRDILFTYGPLGFMEWPQPLGRNLLYANLFFAATHLAFIFSLVKLSLIGNTPRLLAVLIILVAACLIAPFRQLNLVFITGGFCLIHYSSRNPAFIAGAIFSAALAILVRSSYGIAAALILLSYAAILFYEQRKLSQAMLIGVGYCAAVAILWVATYQNLVGLPGYLRGIFEFSVGNCSAMTLNPKNNWLWLATFAALLVYLPLSVRHKRAYLYYAIFILSVAANLKYAFCREGFGLNYLLIYLIMFFAIFILYVPNITIRHFMVILAALGSFVGNMLQMEVDPFAYTRHLMAATLIDSDSVIKTIFSHEQEKKELLDKSRDLLASQQLSAHIAAQIGQRTVDVYPWELSYVAANGLNWQPRPVIQSYVAYTPYLDRRNADFFNSNAAPQFILWEKNFTGEITSIDGRYLLNDEPLALYQILNWYKPVAVDSKLTN